jgi:hypothetical protein
MSSVSVVESGRNELCFCSGGWLEVDRTLFLWWESRWQFCSSKNKFLGA